MLDRIEKVLEKRMVTLWLDLATADMLKKAAIDTGKTMSKYIADLVERDGKFDIEQLKLVISEMILDNEVPSSAQETNDDIQYYTTKLCETFGIRQA